LVPVAAPLRRPGIAAAAGRTTLLLSGYATVVAGLTWASAGPWDRLRRPGPAPFDTLLTTTAAAGAWLCLAWLTVGFTVAALAALPNAAGRWCAAASVRIAPATVRRLAGLVLDAAIVSGTGLAGALPASAAGWPGLPAATTVPLPDLDRPAAVASGTPIPHPSSTHPSSTHPSTTLAVPPPVSPHVSALVPPLLSPPVRPALAPVATAAAGADAPVHLVTATPRGEQRADEVVVHRGDTLWDIAARHLRSDASDAEIAAGWPRWYEANRHVVGDDANLIQPGQHLRAPTPADTAKEAR